MPRPIRILHILDTLGKGGMENGLVNLINRLDPSRFEHIVCAVRRLGESAQRLPADRVRIMCLDKTDGTALQIPAFARTIRQLRPDIVHSRNWGGIEAVIAGRLVRPCATVHSEHGLDSITGGAEPWYRTRFRRLAYESATRVITVSHALKAFHAQRTGLAVSKISVIHNGVDHLHYAPNPELRARIRNEFAIADDVFCLGAVGSLFPVKDHLTLLKAMRRMAHFQKPWRLFILGDGPERARLQEFAAADPDCAPFITFLGSSNRVPELMQAMDGYILSSLTEGLSNSLLEAMATGLAVVATASGGTPEVVEDGVSGLLFPVADDRVLANHLYSLLLDKARRLRLGQYAARRVREHFSLEWMTAQYDQLYQGVMPNQTQAFRGAA
jgi:sugar transferase (PEP-CTERM/EpsH1 system associated)